LAYIGLIPARAGSKAIPNKNSVDCAGKPLLAYTCEAALGSKSLSRVILSTDSEALAKLGKDFGIEVPFLRPPNLADDVTPMISVIQHALEWAEKNVPNLTGIVLLQPTSPLRTSQHIDEAVKLFVNGNGCSVVSVCEVPHQFLPDSQYQLNGNELIMESKVSAPLRRQDKPKRYARNGPAILILSPNTIRQGKLYTNSILGYRMDRFSSLDIDDSEDLALADLLLKSKILHA
jgi:CMP-N,N'-diacetyllegionaminic acid synthase